MFLCLCVNEKYFDIVTTPERIALKIKASPLSCTLTQKILISITSTILSHYFIMKIT